MGDMLRSDAGLFPVTLSILSAKALMAEVVPDYAIDAPVECTFLNFGLNHTYLIRTANDRYILRIYRAGWRSTPEILYELDVLTHLEYKGVPVSTPVKRNDGNFIYELKAPEGIRQAVLFTYAPGKEPSYSAEEADVQESEARSYRYGSAVARIHSATDDFVSQHSRFRLDLEHLVDRPLTRIKPLLEHRPEDWTYLQDVADQVRARVANLPTDTLEFGFCHGDLHGWNAHASDDGTLTFFDFDCCGPGWRAYDIAVFQWSAKAGEKDGRSWEAFLKGYTDIRNLNDVDLAAVPLFVALRHIWLLGLHAANGHDWGSGWMNDGYFDRSLTFLREWEREHIDGR